MALEDKYLRGWRTRYLKAPHGDNLFVLLLFLKVYIYIHIKQSDRE